MRRVCRKPAGATLSVCTVPPHPNQSIVMTFATLAILPQPHDHDAADLFDAELRRQLSDLAGYVAFLASWPVRLSYARSADGSHHHATFTADGLPGDDRAQPELLVGFSISTSQSDLLKVISSDGRAVLLERSLLDRPGLPEAWRSAKDFAVSEFDRRSEAHPEFRILRPTDKFVPIEETP